MKKTIKKLTLNRETLFDLGEKDLRDVAGGSDGPSLCASWCSEIGKCRG